MSTRKRFDVSIAEGARHGEVRHYGVIGSDLEPTVDPLANPAIERDLDERTELQFHFRRKLHSDFDSGCSIH